MVSEADLPHQDRSRPLRDINEAQVWAMVEASPDGMLLADEQGLILMVNAQIESMFGYDRGDLLGRPVEDLIPERHRQVHTAHRTRYRAEPRSRAMGTSLTLQAHRIDGTEFPVEVSLSPVVDAAGLLVVATVRDISDRVAVEAHTHAVLHTIDEAQDGVFMFTPDTLQFNYVNHGAVNQLGYSEEELLSMTPLHIKPEFTETSFRDLIAPLVSGDIDSHTFITTHRCQDGNDRPVEIILQYPPSAEEGHPRMLVALVRDITERLEVEQAILDQRAKVEVLEDRERLAKDLHDLVIQRLFAAGMGLQSVQPLINDPAAAERVDATVKQLDETIAELRGAIFRLSHPPAATIGAQLVDVIDQAERTLGFQVTLTIDGDLDTISDPVAEQLIPTLTEALSNVARHANASATAVTITTGDIVELRVSDNGDGYHPSTGGGNGLINLRHRASSLGGTMTITADPDGTTLVWTAID